MAPLRAARRLDPWLARLPRGGALPERAWRARHRGIVAILWLHVVALAAIGVLSDQSVVAGVLAVGTIAVFTVAATAERLSPTTRASMATLGLLTSTAVLIGFLDGLIEAHFHFFVTIAVVSLYQSWRPYLLAIGFVLAHHVLLGTLDPGHLYNHAAAIENPWFFALVHAGAVLAESIACLVFWKLTEESLDAERSNREALEQSHEELVTANRAVADLVAMLSHDLRNPLTVLLLSSEVALETWPEMSETQRLDFVRRVHRSGRSMDTLLASTLAVSMLDGDAINPRPAPVRVDVAAREALAALPVPPAHVDLDGLGASVAVVDPGHLGQVLTNLLANAVKYGDGRVALGSRTDGDHVVVSVADSGPGVRAAFVPHLFDRFSRSEEARHGDQQGTGLGLYICRSLLRANGGDITYEPTPGGGSTFILRLALSERTADMLTR